MGLWKPLKTLCESTMGVQSPSTHATVRITQLLPDLDQRFNLSIWQTLDVFFNCISTGFEGI